MAVADAVLPSPPPPPRIVVAVLALVRFVLDPLPALECALPVVAGVLRYLCFTVAWILSAAEAAKVVARRAWDEGSASFLFLKTLMDLAFVVFACSSLVSLALAALLLCPSSAWRTRLQFSLDPGQNSRSHVVACGGIDISWRNGWFCTQGCGDNWYQRDILLFYPSGSSTWCLEAGPGGQQSTIAVLLR